jgi:hypothetical protein
MIEVEVEGNQVVEDTQNEDDAKSENDNEGKEMR